MAVDQISPPLALAVAERHFRVMGSDAHLIIVGGQPTLAGDAENRLHDLEARWSRFIDTSEVSRINRYAGQPVTVSSDTALLIRRSMEAWRFSAGAFDPTVLGAMLRAGYDRSFEQMGPHPSPGFSTLALGSVDLHLEGNEVCVPEGCGFDPGGIGKGLAADLVAEEAMAAGALGACVNVGGDLRVCGWGPDGPGWAVALEHPLVEQPYGQLRLTDGAVATSTTLRRRWSSDNGPRHHLIDPQTGQPSTTDVALAATVSRFAWVAEALAKAVILAGFAHPFDTLGGTGVEGLAVRESGELIATDGLAAFLEHPLPRQVCQD